MTHTMHDEEVNEFNAGFDAYKSGVPVEDAPETTHDMWRPGYAFAAFDDLRAEVEQDAHAIDDAIDAMVAHDHGERDGDCTILFTSEIDKLRAALTTVPAPPQADDRLAWAILGAREMQITIADGPCWSDEDRPHILELDPIEVARRAVEGG